MLIDFSECVAGRSKFILAKTKNKIVRKLVSSKKKLEIAFVFYVSTPHNFK